MPFLGFSDNSISRMLISFFTSVLVFLRQHTKHTQFWFGVQFHFQELPEYLFGGCLGGARLLVGRGKAAGLEGGDLCIGPWKSNMKYDNKSKESHRMMPKILPKTPSPVFLTGTLLPGHAELSDSCDILKPVTEEVLWTWNHLRLID